MELKLTTEMLKQRHFEVLVGAVLSAARPGSRRETLKFI